jgi:hypothetical protein
MDSLQKSSSALIQSLEVLGGVFAGDGDEVEDCEYELTGLSMSLSHKTGLGSMESHCPSIDKNG